MMSGQPSNSYRNHEPYIPSTLSEIDDLLGSMILGAPTFKDKRGAFPTRNLESRFHQLTESLNRVRIKLGDEHYAQLLDLAMRAKKLFAADLDETGGQSDQGRTLLFDMEDLLNDVRRQRVESKLPDDSGAITGD